MREAEQHAFYVTCACLSEVPKLRTSFPTVFLSMLHSTMFLATLLTVEHPAIGLSSVVSIALLSQLRLYLSSERSSMKACCDLLVVYSE